MNASKHVLFVRRLRDRLEALLDEKKALNENIKLLKTALDMATTTSIDDEESSKDEVLF